MVKNYQLKPWLRFTPKDAGAVCAMSGCTERRFGVVPWCPKHWNRIPQKTKSRFMDAYARSLSMDEVTKEINATLQFLERQVVHVY